MKTLASWTAIFHAVNQNRRRASRRSDALQRNCGPTACVDSLERKDLLSATLTRFDSPVGSPDFSNEFVRMDLGDFKVDIDTRYGGTPSRWYNGYESYSVTNPFPGEGVTVMWDQGNDPTQASANGLTLNPIARLDGQQQSYTYYGRETAVEAGASQVTYEVTGYAPFFWLSHESGDDATPTESAVRWDTRYDYARILPQTDPLVSKFYSSGTPVDYVSAGIGQPVDGAIMFMGDDVVPSTLAWNQRLAEMKEGRFAAKIRVSLQKASDDAIAGLMFRRQVPGGTDVSEANAYSSPGYTLNVNKAGTLEIVRVASQGAAPVAVWTASGVASSTINSSAGSLLELRTHNWSTKVEIWLNNNMIGEYNDPTPIKGPHFGLFAQSATGSIRFSDRQVYDVGTEYVARYTGHENGTLTSDIQIRNVEGVSATHQFYFAQMPSVWLGNDFRADAEAILFNSTGSEIVHAKLKPDAPNSILGPGAYQRQILRGDDGDSATAEPYALWLGSEGSRKGLFVIPTAAWVNGQPASHPHAQIDLNNDGRYVVSLNALPAYPASLWPPKSQDLRHEVTSLRMVAEWRPRLEAFSPLLLSISDQTVVEGNSGQKEAAFTVSLNRMPTQIVTVDYSTASGTAVSGVDFLAASASVAFDPADGIITKTIKVPIVGDAAFENDEVFSIQLASPRNAGLGRGSAIGTILNDDTLAAPILTGPSSPTALQRPVVTWTSVTGASRYEIAIDNLTTGTTNVVRTTAASTDLTPGADLGIGSFRVAVRAISPTGSTSPWAIRDFHINTPVTIIPMPGEQSTRRPAIKWSALAGAEKYDLWVDNITTGQSQVIRQQTLTSVSFTPTEDLANGTYKVWVLGIDKGGTAAKWSDPIQFTVAVNKSVRRTVLIDENFEDGVINGFDELPADNDGSGSSARLVTGLSNGDGSKSFAITYARDEYGAKLQKYNLKDYDAIEVEFSTRLPDGIPIENTGDGFAGLKLARLFRSSGSPGGNQLQVQLDYVRANGDYPGSPPRYSIYFFLPNGEKILRVPLTFSRDSWFHVRYLAKMNTPGLADGELTVWLNGIQSETLTGMNYSNTIAERPDGMWVGGNFSYKGVNPETPFRRLIDDVKLTLIQGTHAEAPGIPSLSAVPSPGSNMRPTVSWLASNRAASYEIQIDNVSTGTQAVVRATTNATSYTTSIDLGIGRFQARVRAKNADGVASAWSDSREFIINTAVSIKALDQNQTTARPRIEWNTLPGAVKYDLWINNATTGQSQVVRAMNIQGTSFVPAGELPLSRYNAWVAGIDAEGRRAAWSSATSFSVVVAPQPNGPKLPTFERRPTFTWSSVGGATGYDVFVQNLTTKKTDYYPRSIAGTSWTPPAELTIGTYRWWIQAVGPNGFRSFWSASADTSIGGRPVLLQPTGSTNAVRPVFVWTVVRGASSYRLWVDRLDVAKSAVINVTGITSDRFTATSDLAKGTYRVWIQAISSTGERSAWSAPVDIRIVNAEKYDQDLKGLRLASIFFDQLTTRDHRVDIDIVETQHKPVTDSDDTVYGALVVSAQSGLTAADWKESETDHCSSQFLSEMQHELFSDSTMETLWEDMSSLTELLLF